MRQQLMLIVGPLIDMMGFVSMVGLLSQYWVTDDCYNDVCDKKFGSLCETDSFGSCSASATGMGIQIGLALIVAFNCVLCLGQLMVCIMTVCSAQLQGELALEWYFSCRAHESMVRTPQPLVDSCRVFS